MVQMFEWFRADAARASRLETCSGRSGLTIMGIASEKNTRSQPNGGIRNGRWLASMRIPNLLLRRLFSAERRDAPIETLPRTPRGWIYRR